MLPKLMIERRYARVVSGGILLLLMLFPLTGSAQQPFFRFQPLKHSALATDPVMIRPDDDGRMWVGTKQGLHRLEGNSFRKIPVVGQEESVVSAIYQTRDGELWVGYLDGSVRIMKGDRLHKWEPEEGLPVKAITGFAEDDLGQLWISTYGEGLYCLAKNGRLYNLGPDDGPLQHDIYALCSGPNGEVWAGTDAGISVCTFRRGNKKIRRFNDLPDEIVLSLLADDHNVWIGTHEGGLVRYDTEQKIFNGMDSSGIFGAIVQLVNGVGDEQFALNQAGELFRVTAGKIHRVHPRKAQETRLDHLGTDKEGNLWLLDAKSGLYSASLRFDFMDMDFGQPQTVLKIVEGATWVGTENGLIRKGPESENYQTVSGSAGTNVLCIYALSEKDGSERILVGTFGQGLLVCQAENCRRIGEAEGLPNTNILSIDGGRGDTIWMATLGGVLALDLASLEETKPLVRKLKGVAEGFIYQLHCAPDDILWVATDGDGLLRYDESGVKRISLDENFLEDRQLPSTVFSVVPARGGGIWVNSQEKGILKFDQGKLKQLNVGDYLVESGQEISGLLEAPSGELIVVHPQGVSLFSSSDSTWLTYGAQSGFTTGGSAFNAIGENEDGEIWLVAGNQLVHYRSDSGLRSKPVTRLTSVLASGLEIEANDTTLAYDQNYLVFSYEGNWLTDQEAVSYRYWLKGHDQNWITSADDRVNYSNLSPGKYAFWLESGLNGQFSGRPDLTYEFSIASPWWMRWWALLGFVTLFGLILNLLTYHRRNRRARLLLLEKERVQSELAALKAQVNPHFLFNSFSTLIATIERSPDNAIAYVEQLSAFFRKVLSMRQTDLLPLVDELELAQNYFYLLRKRFGEKLRLEVDCPDHGGLLPPMSLQILVENAVKHNMVSRRHPMIIEITRKGNVLLVRNPVHPKRKPEISTGFGLSAIRRRYQLLGIREPRVEESGGYFCVHLPIL
ncbi:hypothetical protein CEQ90_15830 [Lewinellaceae bacterium SD302]|nr:hypothetical protein CEQ90_15830 [Lewinellaceae bacterium SD302]